MARRLPVLLWLLAAVISACASTGARDGLDVSRLPEEVRPDYALFARRCSKCHPLARALNSGIDDDARWVDYVTRMRRQPGSGIAPQDTAPILRFLHYYSLEQRRVKHERALAAQGAQAASGSSAPSAGDTPELARDR